MKIFSTEILKLTSHYCSYCMRFDAALNLLKKEKYIILVCKKSFEWRVCFVIKDTRESSWKDIQYYCCPWECQIPTTLKIINNHEKNNNIRETEPGQPGSKILTLINHFPFVSNFVITFLIRIHIKKWVANIFLCIRTFDTKKSRISKRLPDSLYESYERDIINRMVKMWMTVNEKIPLICSLRIKRFFS